MFVHKKKKKMVHEQLDKSFYSILSQIYYDFSKAHSTLHCHMVMQVELKESRTGRKFGAFFSAFSKGFDTIYHNILITK